ncbi:uncharacterized protein si:dkeyp-75h12.7 isoform X2 [Electrophorus electricus]|uniref:uncharacterized protein si:dkeyp-75h12.7 isoform X2 n=1 Tax=Electrophorus electricus TaxID=8005 RepID=UPI0015D0337F|nr:uncharacterized protein si:dkeyp-75h12.7 isoform X2 [Electrophorus electricus]
MGKTPCYSSFHFSCADLVCSPRPVAAHRREEWQNVSSCFQIFVSSCDVSQGITDFDVYNYIRVGLGYSSEDLLWTESVSCDPLKDQNGRFSPPSISISLEERRIWVEVAFPCAPAAACWEQTPALRCCSVIDFLQLNTTLWLYNKHNASDAQTRTELVQKGGPFSVEFIWLTPGQEYCVVVSTASSPFSRPQCVYVPVLENLNLVVLGLSGVLITFLLIAVCGLGIRWASSDSTLPKSLLALQSVNQEDPFESELRRPSLEAEGHVLSHLSIISLSNMVVFEPDSHQEPSSSLGAGYYASPLLQHSACPGDHEETGDLETDGGSSPPEGPEFVQLWEPAHADSLPLGLPGVPLSSVRLARAQGDEAELHHLPSLLMNLNGDHDTHAQAAGYPAEQNMSSDIKLMF